MAEELNIHEYVEGLVAKQEQLRRSLRTSLRKIVT